MNKLTTFFVSVLIAASVGMPRAASAQAALPDVSPIWNMDAPSRIQLHPSQALPLQRRPETLIDAVRSLIRQYHISTDATDAQLDYGMIKGMVGALNDPFSHFLDPEEAKAMQQAMAGNFGGAGLSVQMDHDKVVVAQVMEGGGGASVGIKVGDFIVGIDDKPVGDLNLNEVVRQIRGPEGTTVKLNLLRGDKRLNVTVTRKKVVVPSVKWREASVGKKRYQVITLTQFGDDTGELFNKAAAETVAKHMVGIVLDLRNNGGGRLDMAGAVVCNWLPAGTPFVLEKKGRKGEREADLCKNRPQLIGVPTVVLLNGYSASASEITAGALQDLKLATVLGEKSFGKGVGQSVIPFRDGSVLVLVSFEWFTPAGRAIHKVGITPDIVVKQPEEKKDVQLERALKLLSTGK